MVSMKKFFPTLLLILLVYAWYFFQHLPAQQKQSSMHVLGADTNITLYEQPKSGRTPLLTAIQSAKKEILVEVYLLSDKEIIQALEQADATGIDVKVILEQHPFGGGNLNPKTKQDLDIHGVETHWSNPAFALTHEKVIIIDGMQAFVLSQNLTTSSFTKNREYDVWDTDSDDATQLRTIFFADWEQKSFSPPQKSDLIESPDNSRTVLIALIMNAEKSIEAETEDINDEQLIDSLSQKAKLFQVRLLVPTLSQLEGNKPSLEKLKAAGVSIRTISSPYMHAKMILTDDNRAYVGSINFSTQSMDKNREVGIILTQPNALSTLEQTYQSDWEKAKPF
jgi:phosphatidylserine/phosphatidylglycerophosphate/cardiolipin synthase-like enzyme